MKGVFMADLKEKMTLEYENGLKEEYLNHNGEKLLLDKNNMLTVGVIGLANCGKTSVISAIDFADLYDFNIRNRKIEETELDGCKILTIGLSLENKIFNRDSHNEYILRFVESDKNNDDSVIAFSSVVLIVLDSPSLMEKGADNFKDFNYTDTALKNLLNISLKKDTLVIFVPVKCEKYMISDDIQQDMNELSKKIRNKYKNTISLIQQIAAASLILPVITEGNKVFKEYNEKEEEIFEKISLPDKTRTFLGKFVARKFLWQPLFAEQLLLTIIRFRLEPWVRAIYYKRPFVKLKNKFNKTSSSYATQNEKLDKKIVTMLKNNLFRHLVKLTRIMDDNSWDKLVRRESTTYGIKPKQTRQGFDILHDPQGYFEDIISLVDLQNSLS